MCNDATSGTYESNGPIWKLEFMHITGIPPHLRFGGQMENCFFLVCDGRKVRHVCVHGVHAIVHMHQMKVEGREYACRVVA